MPTSDVGVALGSAALQCSLDEHWNLFIAVWIRSASRLVAAGRPTSSGPCLVMIIRRLVVHDGSLLGALDRQSSSFYDPLT